MKPSLFLLAVTVLGSCAALRAQGYNVFEARHAQSEAKNPPGLSMVLDTRDSRRSYSEGEYIPLVISYSSDIRDKYKVETGLGWNGAAESQRLYTDEQITPVKCLVARTGYGWRLLPLNSKPVIVPHCIFVRLKPGKHEVYVTASQVFPWSTEEESRKELLTTSNVLWLDEQGQLLKSVLLNCSTDGVSLWPVYRKPFDLIFQRARTEDWSALADDFRTFLLCQPLMSQPEMRPTAQ